MKFNVTKDFWDRQPPYNLDLEMINVNQQLFSISMKLKIIFRLVLLVKTLMVVNLNDRLEEQQDPKRRVN